MSVFRRIVRRKAFLLTIVLSVGLLSAFGGAATVQAADWSRGVVIRADRIEIKGLLPLLATGNDGGPVLRLIAREAKVYGMRLSAGQRIGGRSWGMEIGVGGMVPIRGLQVDVTALGFRIEGFPIQIGDSVPELVLHDVFMKVDELDAKRIDLTRMELKVKPRVSLEPEGPVLDLRPFAAQGLAKASLEEKVNEQLARMATESPKETKQGKDTEPQGEEPEGDEKRDAFEGTESPGLTDPHSGSDPQLPDSEDSGEAPEQPDESSIETKLVVTQTIGPTQANQIVEETQKYDASVVIQKGEQQAKADDYDALVGLGLVPGTEIVLKAEGKEAQPAVEALTRLLTEAEK